MRNVIVAVAVALLAAPDGLRAAGAARPVVWSEVDAAARDAALRPARRPPVRHVPAPAAGAPGVPEAPGDRLALAKDDGFETSPAFGWEGRLAPRPGAAGGADFVAFRFGAVDLARTLPVTLTGVVLGLDNAYGRVAWPAVGIALEDRTAPLRPDLATLSAAAGFAGGLSLPPPSGPEADAFQRFAVDVPDLVLGPDLDVDDGALTDRFDRPDEPLATLGSAWLECDLASCPGGGRLLVAGSRLVKSASGARVGARVVKDAAVAAARPIYDRDLRIRASYDVTVAAAESAGLAFRVEFAEPGLLDRYYVAEYSKPAARVALWAVAGGTPALLASAPVAPAPSALLEVRVEGINPTRIRVHHAGGAAPVIDHVDAVHNFGGWVAGVASLPALAVSSAGEAWDGFEVLRNPDAFAVVQFPPGVDAALPGERTPSSLAWHNVLTSLDGSSWAAAATEPFCARPPQGFAQIEVTDPANVFQAEYKLDAIRIACPSCLDRDNPCRANPSPGDALEPVLEVGAPVSIAAWWWNDHAPDLADLLVRMLVYRGACFQGTPEATDVRVADPGQLRVGPVHVTTPGPTATWVPSATGPHCIVALELYDLNRDGCPDGFETAGCAPVANPDQNFATQGLYREVEVFAPCTPLPASNLDANGLRAGRDAAGEPVLAWERQDPGVFPGSYNVHVTTAREDLPVLRTEVPPSLEVVAALGTALALGDPAGGIGYFAVFENDGCESQRSLPDP